METIGLKRESQLIFKDAGVISVETGILTAMEFLIDRFLCRSRPE